ncbi:potassium channel family protein [Roseinatronobacter monicus]|uniref:Voltage-gated potassium channel n=1 Tax=Roseinatronobacter monicus TaxID=393481 RepID=A0A543KGF1_9RHOB|nr:potassium channel family protein [Roseinatronobacter monicus]TQM94132.1 voltage-gated potassium channel [Roseinatronobacter monicus]
MPKERASNRAETLRARVDKLYHGRTKAGLRFRLVLLAFDLVVIGSYVLTSALGVERSYVALDLLLAAILIADLSARWLISSSTRAFVLRNPFHWADIIVILSLIAPLVFGDFAFLRVLRALRVARSYRVLQELRADSRVFKRNEELVQRAVNLLVFIFVVSGFVHALQKGINPGITTWLDALYFTMAALTTTGFGDIVLVGTSGKWLSIAILIVGVGLFLHLLQSVFQPSKVRQKCETCGLLLHDHDAIHCKHCGAEVKIETEGQ